ncbi:MAG: S1 family peptidase [Bdellovibrio sp.]
MAKVWQKSIFTFLVLSFLVACGQQGAPGSSNAWTAVGDEQGVFGGTRMTPEMALTRYVAGLRYRLDDGGMGSCTAALINEQTLLTAAHCVPKDKASMKIYFTTSMEDVANVPAKNIRRVSDVIVHEKYEEAKGDLTRANPFDIAVLRIESSAPSHYRHLQLATENFPISQISKAYVVGYGFESYDSKTRLVTGDQALKSAIVERKEVGDPNFLMLNQTKGTGICVGDSGGPMIVQNAAGFIIMGTASTVHNGTNFATCRGDSVYISVASMRNWIIQSAFEMSQQTN